VREQGWLEGQESTRYGEERNSGAAGACTSSVLTIRKLLMNITGRQTYVLAKLSWTPSNTWRTNSYPSLKAKGWLNHIGGRVTKPRNRADGQGWWLLKAYLDKARRAARELTPERLFWALMVTLMVAYVILLIVQPTGTGRGGR
jgi:hypothetical protein